MREYHHGLAQHLLDLIRKSTSALASSSTLPSTSTSPVPRKQTVTPPLPVNPRQHSDSSLDSNSKVSSGQTTQSRKSSVEQTTVTTEEEEGEHEVADDEDEDEDECERRGSDNDDRGSHSVALSDRNDLTARPDAHPPRFPSIPLVNVEDASPAESSARGAQRYANVRVSPSPSASPNGKVARTRLSTYPSTHAEHLSREAEHRKAWETTGRRVWRNMPVNFELTLAALDRKKKKTTRSGSNQSQSQHSVSDISGAGPGTAMRPDDRAAAVSELDNDPEAERMSSSNPTNIGTVSVSEASKCDVDAEGGPIPSESSVSMSIAKPTIKRTSTLQRRQARVEAAAEAAASAAIEQQQLLLPQEPQHQMQESEADEVEASENEQAEYAAKREIRLRKKEQALKKRIGLWWSGVAEHYSGSSTPPEIEPHIPSPKILYGEHSSILRFPPLPTSMPDFIGGNSPMLTLPSLQLIEDGRKNRFTHLGMGQDGDITDIDLLIRLTELNRISSASPSPSGTGRARFPSAPPHLASPAGSGSGAGGIFTGGRTEYHSFNVKGSMPTPRPKPAMRSVFSGFESTSASASGSTLRLPPS